jgi:hypothetical protein
MCLAAESEDLAADDEGVAPIVRALPLTVRA